MFSCVKRKIEILNDNFRRAKKGKDICDGSWIGAYHRLIVPRFTFSCEELLPMLRNTIDERELDFKPQIIVQKIATIID